ncbi:MAG: DUF1080 domain-containing protein [Candidatus Omnitrophica bacterium]|nr:DUF1080 domain-containing protein [Candidatus Omnitrophota bacterium]
MWRFYVWLTSLVWVGSALAAEQLFTFSDYPLHEPPPGFRSTVSGSGKPGDWQIIQDEVAPLMAPITSKAPSVAKRAVLAQLARDPTDEHFPMLIFEGEEFGDFVLTTRFKTVAGEREQMAGIAFRIQDENNYYVVRASSLGGTFRFYKVVNGVRGEFVGTNMVIATNVWHDLTVECKGNRLRFQLDGKQPIPDATDYSFTSGKIGFWTKSDSVSYFVDTRIQYTPREPLAVTLVRDMIKKYPRLVGLAIYVQTNSPPVPHIIASKQPQEIGRPGGEVEQNVISRDTIYCGRNGNKILVTMPIHDRNGESVAAVRVTMKTFLGQTDRNAIARAMPIVHAMEARVRSKNDLIE